MEGNEWQNRLAFVESVFDETDSTSAASPDSTPTDSATDGSSDAPLKSALFVRPASSHTRD